MSQIYSKAGRFARMALPTCIVLMFLWSIPSSSHAKQRHDKYIIELGEKKLQDVFKEISEITGYKLMIPDEVDLNYDVEWKNSSTNIRELMDIALKNSPYRYKIINTQIIISLKEENRIEKTSTKQEQKQIIEGKVVDEEGEGLLGVTVVEKENRLNGMITGIEGVFSLKVDPSSTLVFSSVGYVTVEEKINGQKQLRIVMQEDVQQLSEVIVVGYGVQKKESLTGSVASLGAQDVRTAPVSGIDQAMQGRVAGVQVVSSGGAPGGDVEVRVRGIGSFGNSSPLYIVDGFPVDNINSINAADVESVSILKDASAAAIYGSRAANGVMLITTKKGEPGAMQVSLNTYHGVQSSWNNIDVLDAKQRNQVKKQAAINDGNIPDPMWDDSFAQVDRTDWQDEIFRTAYLSNTDISLKGGSEKSTYNFSASYFTQEGIVINSGYERLTVRLNSEHKIGENLTWGENLTVVNSETDEPISQSNWAGPLYGSIAMHPDVPVFDADGNYSGIPDGNVNRYGEIENPVGAAERLDQTRSIFSVFGNTYLNYEMFEGINLKTDFGYEKTFNEHQRFWPIVPEPGRPKNVNEQQFRENNSDRWIWTNTLNLNKTFDKHDLGILLGQSIEQKGMTSSWTKYLNFMSDADKIRVPDGATEVPFSNGNYQRWSMMSFFGRINYGYDNRYLFEAVIRADGSSRFADGNQWGTFPSVSAAWRISEEEFFSSLKSTVSELKLRGGFGVLGNQDIGTSYPTYGTMKRNLTTIGGETVYGYYMNVVPNPEITWETTVQSNFGLDLEVLDGKFLLTADYFVKNTEDMLVPVVLPALSATDEAQFQNIGEVKNSGLELALTYRKKEGDFTYSITGNLATLDNEVIALNGGQPLFSSDGYNRTAVGSPIGEFYGLNVEGIFQSAEEVNAYVGKEGKIQPNAKRGDFKFSDLDGSGKITDDDKTELGSPLPSFTYGFNLNMAYKNFDFSAFFQGLSGAKAVNRQRTFLLFASKPTNHSVDILDAWTSENSSTDIPRLSEEDPNGNNRFSSFYVEDADYFRLKNLVIGYTFNKKLIEKVGISNLRVYFQTQNLFTITDYSGWDPEIGASYSKASDNYNSLSMGVDNGQYPAARSFIIGVNLKF